VSTYGEYPRRLRFGSEERLPISDAVDVLQEEAASYELCLLDEPDGTLSVYNVTEQLMSALEQRIYDLAHADEEEEEVEAT
jgi:hypothetical protein